MITKRNIFLFFFTCSLAAWAGDGWDVGIPLVSPGHPSLQTENLKFPRSVYYMRVKNQNGEWVTQGTLTEQGKMVSGDGGELVKRAQVTTFNDGKSYIAHTATFDRKSLKPVKNERQSNLPQYSDGFVKSFELTYEDRKLVGRWDKQGSGASDFPGIELDQAMFEGDVLGVVIAALPLKKGYKARLPVMYSQMGTRYMVVARVVGQKSFKTGTGQEVQAWAVETDWHDLDSGNVSPGGGSGGTYYVVPRPPRGYPHVPKYINDNFDTEVLPQMLSK